MCSANQGPPHVPKMLTSKLPISKDKETSENKLVGKYALLYAKIYVEIV